MRDISVVQRRRKKFSRSNNIILSFLSKPYTFIFLLLIFAFLIFSPLLRYYNQARQVNKEIEDLQAKIDSFNFKNKEAGELFEYLQSPQFIEEQLRLNMSMKKPGEEVVVIKDLDDKQLFAPEEEIISLSNAKKWWKYFLN